MRRPRREVVRSLTNPTIASSSAPTSPPTVSSTPTTMLGRSVGGGRRSAGRSSRAARGPGCRPSASLPTRLVPYRICRERGSVTTRRARLRAPAGAPTCDRSPRARPVRARARRGRRAATVRRTRRAIVRAGASRPSRAARWARSGRRRSELSVPRPLRGRRTRPRRRAPSGKITTASPAAASAAPAATPPRTRRSSRAGNAPRLRMSQRRSGDRKSSLLAMLRGVRGARAQATASTSKPDRCVGQTTMPPVRGTFALPATWGRKAAVSTGRPTANRTR